MPRWPEGYVAKTSAERSRQYRDDHPGRREDQSARLRQERRLMLDRIKLEAGCLDCGFNKHPAALQFDHVRGEKSFDIGSTGSAMVGLQRVLDEIAKCVIRCANCHAIKTAGLTWLSREGADWEEAPNA